MENYSTSNINDFHEIEQLKKILIKLAALNIILCDEEWLRYHRYTKEWSKDVDQAEIDNGSGDNMFIFFSNKGCVIKGFDHESEVSPHARDEFKVWDGMYEGLPSHLEHLLDDVSVEKEDVTFCIWKENEASNWNKGNVTFKNGEDDGSGFLLGTIYSNSKEFKEWADDYFELELSETLISDVFNDKPFTDNLILGLNDSCDLNSVKKELRELGVMDLES